MIVALLVSAAAVQPVPAPPAPPPMVTTTVSPPPIMTVPVISPPVITPRGSDWDRPTETIAVRVSVGNDVLIDDRFLVGNSPASFTQSRSEANAKTCGAGLGASNRSHINLMLRADGLARENRYRVTFSWNRPAGACEKDGTRGLSVERPVVLTPGGRAVVDGDSGLKVELRRL